MKKNGIDDSFLTPTHNGIAPEGYYRNVYQSKKYTLREWGKYFRTVDYNEGVMGNFQDLVILQKKGHVLKEVITSAKSTIAKVKGIRNTYLSK